VTYTLDTDTCIAYLRGKHLRVYQRVLSHFSEIAITSVVAAELYYLTFRLQRARGNETPSPSGIL